MRNIDSSRVLWIDAICINQTDIPERNAQVSTMKRTYEEADRVLVWLGEERENSALVMQGNMMYDSDHLTMWEDKGTSVLSLAFNQFLKRA